ncbi:MAG: hypothetical protein PUP91_03090 [Rhizonema sp. PD37]|nr:hypothetical protein [Rhizonema sp. PD37]
MKINITQKFIKIDNQFNLAVLRIGGIITIAGILSGIAEATAFNPQSKIIAQKPVLTDIQVTRQY